MLGTGKPFTYTHTTWKTDEHIQSNKNIHYEWNWKCRENIEQNKIRVERL